MFVWFADDDGAAGPFFGDGVELDVVDVGSSFGQF